MLHPFSTSVHYRLCCWKIISNLNPFLSSVKIFTLNIWFGIGTPYECQREAKDIRDCKHHGLKQPPKTKKTDPARSAKEDWGESLLANDTSIDFNEIIIQASQMVQLPRTCGEDGNTVSQNEPLSPSVTQPYLSDNKLTQSFSHDILKNNSHQQNIFPAFMAHLSIKLVSIAQDH